MFKSLCLCSFLGSLFFSEVANAQSLPSIDPATFHQLIVSECLRKNTESEDPMPSDIANRLCTCTDNWMKQNNINGVDTLLGYQSAMSQVGATCMNEAMQPTGRAP